MREERGVCSKPREAEDCCLEAMKVARRQRAKSWELRAATSLARIRGSPEAREALEKAHDWFTEGFETQDLADARELLASLASGNTVEGAPDDRGP